MAFPSQEEGSRFWNQHLDPSLSSRGQYSSAQLFTTDLDHEPPQYPYLYDVQVALMRTRYYSAKYVVHLPFVYKALHYPEQFTQEDADGAADCLKVCRFTLWLFCPALLCCAVLCYTLLFCVVDLRFLSLEIRVISYRHAFL
jgi:hypothetical protein